MHRLSFLVISLLLSGCAMPAAVTVASLAADASSYLTTGKTMSAHGLSLAVGEDCSLLRLLDEDREICREPQDYEVAEAILTPLPDDWPSYARLARQVDRARAARVTYLAAGLIESES